VARGAADPGDTLQGGDARMKKMWLNLERTVDERDWTAKKVITLQTAMTKKSSVFFRKK